MRQIILDTETTGLSTAEGDRLIEIGCIELINRRYTRNYFHHYFNPERKISAGAQAVHGITNEFLADKPLFKNLVHAFLEFIQGAELIIHNAPFDVGFINYELQKVDSALGDLSKYCTVFDTLPLARQRHPGQPNNLDALCKRYQIDHTQREFHGALLDAKLLAEVYLQMTGGQTSLFGVEHKDKASIVSDKLPQNFNMSSSLVIYANEAELQQHWRKLAKIKKNAAKILWPETEEIRGG